MVSKNKPAFSSLDLLEQCEAQPVALPAASASFRARVMADIAQRELPWHVRLRRFLFRPHQLQWNVATMMLPTAFATVLMMIMVLPASNPPSVSSPPAMVKVRFELQQDNAQQVALSGGFSQWQPTYALQKNAQGLWVVDVQLEPGRYEYMFVVDGEQWVVDSRAQHFQDDGFGGKNAVVIVNSGKAMAQESSHAI